MRKKEKNCCNDCNCDEERLSNKEMKKDEKEVTKNKKETIQLGEQYYGQVSDNIINDDDEKDS